MMENVVYFSWWVRTIAWCGHCGRAHVRAIRVFSVYSSFACFVYRVVSHAHKM